MPERLIDVMDRHGRVLHIFPVALGEEAADAADFEAKALAAAAHLRLVPDAELGTLTASTHVSRGGALATYGDDLDTDSETKLGLERIVRELARTLWEQDGRPQEKSEEYWHRALDQRLRERAYVLWQQEGSPEGRADEYWRRVRDFEAF